MAQIVTAVGSSHGPSIQTSPDRWPELGEKDIRDPRFDYQAFLKAAKPGLDKEITPEVMSRRHAAAHAALDRLTGLLAEARLDVVIVISNPHRLAAQTHRPVFGVLRTEELPVRNRLEGPIDPPTRRRIEAEITPSEIFAKPGCAALANHLIETLIEDDFDVACIDRLAEGATLDDAFTFPYKWLLQGSDLPMVPFILSRDLPNQPTPRRCFALGKALRRAIEAWPGDRRIGLIASGGLSHQVVDEELDRGVIRALEQGDGEAMCALSRERLNRSPGTPEILNWVTVAAAMAPATMELVDYLPCYRSLAGTGHGLTFGFWR